MTPRSWIRRRAAVLAAVILLCQPHALFADDIVVMTSGAFTAAYLELGPAYERSTKHKLVTATTAMGTGAESIPNRLLRGEAALGDRGALEVRARAREVVRAAVDACEGAAERRRRRLCGRHRPLPEGAPRTW